MREQYKLRKRWRTNRTRQPGESEDGDGVLTLDRIKEMALDGRCRTSVRLRGCHPWYPKTRWDLPKEDDYIDNPEVDFQRFIAGIVDAIEVADRWEEARSRMSPDSLMVKDRGIGMLLLRWLV